MAWLEPFRALPLAVRTILIILLAVVLHLVVKAVRAFSEWLLTSGGREPGGAGLRFSRRFPRAASILTILVSGLTFTIYFIAIGLALREIFQFNFTTYLASASVLGLAIGFGSQGFVQDVVVGLTLIFSDAINIGEMVETSGQVGRVDNLGLRFTTLVSLQGQRVHIPNRTIGIISRFRGGGVRAYADLQVPADADAEQFTQMIVDIAHGLHQQYRGLVLAPPAMLGLQQVEPGGWRYLRIKFKVWPGQQGIIETTFRQRVLTALRSAHGDYPDWMFTVTFRVED